MVGGVEIDTLNLFSRNDKHSTTKYRFFLPILITFIEEGVRYMTVLSLYTPLYLVLASTCLSINQNFPLVLAVHTKYKLLQGIFKFCIYKSRKTPTDFLVFFYIYIGAEGVFIKD